MNNIDIFSVFGKIVLALGGAGAIIVAVSGFIARLWAKWFMEKQKNKYQKEIEGYKNELAVELAKCRTLNEKILHKEIFIYDEEFKIYKEIMPGFRKASKSVLDYLVIIKLLVEKGIEDTTEGKEKIQKAYHYQDTNLVLYQKYTYEDACRLLNWERNEVPLNIGGYKYDKKTKTFPIFINYDKQDNISDTTKYEDHFVAENRLIAISKSGRSMDSEDVQNFLNATERGIDVQLFVRKNKDDKISKEFYYLGRVIATGNAKQFVMPNTDKTAVEIEWELETPVREDIYQYIVNE